MGMTLQIQSTATTETSYGDVDVGPISIAGSIGPIQTSLVLASGNNSFTVPSTAVGAIISPPTTNAIVLIFKTTSGDVGVNMPPSAPTIVRFDTANRPATLFVNAASQTTGYTQVLFF